MILQTSEKEIIIIFLSREEKSLNKLFCTDVVVVFVSGLINRNQFTREAA
jgi:hypothetical protein